MGDKTPSIFATVVEELVAFGIALRSRPGEYVVNFRGGSEATAYVTDDLDDAFTRGQAMAAERIPAPAASTLACARWSSVKRGELTINAAQRLLPARPQLQISI